jgi:hypothetical protein
MARILRVDKKTIARRLIYFAAIAREEHLDFLKTMPKLAHVQADEMESFEHTKLKPVSIPLAVAYGSRKILAYDVVKMPAKGPLAHLSRKKYGFRPDERKAGFLGVLGKIKPLLREECVISTDMKTAYRPWIQSVLPGIQHRTTKGRRGCIVGHGELKEGGFDPLFSLNHTAAMNRDNINRLRRRTWATTKLQERLKDHIAIYVHYHNTVLTKKKL